MPCLPSRSVAQSNEATPSPQRRDGKFRNAAPRQAPGFRKTLGIAWRVLTQKPDTTVPRAPIPVQALDAAALTGGPAHIVANLPYNIGTALLVRWLSTAAWAPWWLSCTLMFQKEVAQRIIATPGSDAYGRLAVLTQWRARARIAFEVPPQAFTPAPKVSSAVVHIVPTAPLGDIAVTQLESLTAAAFGQRRKMLRGSLRGLSGGIEALAMCGIDPARRAETLSIIEFVALTAALSREIPTLRD